MTNIYQALAMAQKNIPVSLISSKNQTLKLSQPPTPKHP